MASPISWTSSTTKIKAALSSSNIEYFHSRSKPVRAFQCTTGAPAYLCGNTHMRRSLGKDRQSLNQSGDKRASAQKTWLFPVMLNNELHAINWLQGRHD